MLNFQVNILLKNVIDVGLGGFVFWSIGFGLVHGEHSNSSPYYGLGHFFFAPGDIILCQTGTLISHNADKQSEKGVWEGQKWGKGSLDHKIKNDAMAFRTFFIHIWKKCLDSTDPDWIIRSMSSWQLCEQLQGVTRGRFLVQFRHFVGETPLILCLIVRCFY